VGTLQKTAHTPGIVACLPRPAFIDSHFAQVEEEAKAVFNCLNTFENMIETDPSVAEQVRKTARLCCVGNKYAY